MIQLLKRIINVNDAEIPGVLWSTAYGFCVLCSYYAIRPIRDTTTTLLTDQDFTVLLLWTLAVMLVATPLFGWLVSRFPRRSFLPVCHRFFACSFVAFFVMLLPGTLAQNIRTAGALSVWISVFSLFNVSIFWAFMADLWESGQGKRLFGFIGVGGTLGGIAGSSLAAWCVTLIPPAWLLLVAVLFLEAAVLCVRRLSALFHVDETIDSNTILRVADDQPSKSRGPGLLSGDGALGGFLEIVRSRYLLLICGYMVLFTITSTLLYVEQRRIVAAHFPTEAAKTGALAHIDLWTNTVTAIVQILLAGRIIKFLGIGGALALLPLLTAAGFAALAETRLFVVLMVVQVLRRSADYALVRPAREVLFTVLPREQKYKAKNLIDTVIYRGGDALGAWMSTEISGHGTGPRVLAVIAAPLTLVWGLVGLSLGRAQSRRAATTTNAEPQSAPVAA